MPKALFLRGIVFVLVWLLFASTAYPKDEPSLPAGLEASKSSSAKEPVLPMGLGKAARPTEPEAGKSDDPDLPFEFSGFWGARLGFRTQNDPYEKDVSIGETRLQLRAEKNWEKTAVKISADLLFDPVQERYSVNLEEGEGLLDLREANLSLTPADFVDVKVGRQILTWGTGDLIFINDLFPKDWKAFILGREEEYLKAPSDAVKVSIFSKIINFNLVYTPRFDSDRIVDGTRVSYFNSVLGRRAGRDSIVRTEKPVDWFEDDEVAARLYRNIQGYELAFYAYHGFWSSPAGMNPVTGKATFPRLSVLGASLRGSFLKGIGFIESGYNYSVEDRNGLDPLIRNSEFRFLAGYEQEVFKEFTVEVQYYLERMAAYNSYRLNLPAGSPRADENRHVLTLRLTKMLMNQNLRISLFVFYSPSDADIYLRPNLHYKINDLWSFEAGGNFFTGRQNHTFFGQLKNNSNIFFGLKYSF